MLFLVATMVLGAAFLGIKAVEYADKFEHHHVPGPGFHFEPEAFAREAQIFFSLYFVMTGLHALHMIIGLGIMMWMLRWAWTGLITPSTRARSRSAASTGISWTSCGSSCFPCSTCSGGT